MTHTASTGNPARMSGGEKFRLRLSAVAWFVLAALFLLSVPVLVDVSWLAILAIAILALVLSLPAAWIVRALFSGQRMQAWRTSVAKAFLALLFVLGIAAAAPIFYFALYTALRPTIVPQAVLSNGSKTVVFQGMMHIGSEGFYKSVVYDLEKALVDGYVLYYEGVQGSPEGDAWFNKTLGGGGDLNTNYQVLSDVCGLNFQLDYFGLLQADMALHPERHVQADVTTGQMMNEFNRLIETDPAFAAAEQDNADPAPATGAPQTGLGIEGLVRFLQGSTPELRNLAGTVCRGFLSMTLGGTAAPDEMDKVVLDFRNRELAARVEGDTSQLIYITYGAAHLPGLLADLQAADPAWAIQSVKWMRTITSPEELEGRL